METITQGFGGSTFSFMWQDTALAAMRKMQTLGLNDFDVLVVPGHLWPDQLSAADRSVLAGNLRSEGIRIESLNLPALDLNLVSRVEEFRRYSIDLYIRTMQLAADLGAGAVVVVPGRVSSLFPPPGSDTEHLLRDSLEQLLRVAERLDQKIFVELHPQTPIPTSDAMLTFLDGLAHEKLLIAYDVSNAEFVGEGQPDAIRRLGNRIGQLHFSDGTRSQWRHDRVGHGTVCFDEILKAVNETRFSGVCVLEIISSSPLEDLGASAAALKRIAID
ncbi:sugar phosphate isomerase/epimerase [Paraburkholderia sp. CNPSo 3274]|uniref:sugar phosphate isomerase/epimerase family protein n=1 Tax=Paraburkholderia sp. CNPSo 3274 TaxID=2940932 RepID=UPI0020B6938A|nr:sugar phosphate isomerase/epimerase family protein [Paraburkholderia sp. CNPSo 3274]MCP3712439.1 sugar phosphate isomerase/epimerase [Paraburkholderia sp. CNPSo 3274]